MKMFLYENVGPAPIAKASSTVAIDRYLDRRVFEDKKKTVQISGQEFLDVLEAAIHEQEKQEVIQANQMSLRRL